MYVVTMIPRLTKMLQSVAFFAGDKIYTEVDLDSDPNYIRICDQCAMKLLKNTATMVGLIIVSCAIYSCFPVYAFIFHNEIQLFCPVLLPFTDLESVNGIILNFINQMFINLIGISASIGIEIATCIVKNNVSAIVVAIGYETSQLSKYIESNVNESSKSIHVQFRNMLIQIQDFDRYIFLK